MRNLTRLRDRYDLDEAVVRIECPCLFTREFDGLSEFTESEGGLASEQPLLVKCPRCTRVYTAHVHITRRENERDRLTISLESTENDDEVRRLPAGSCPNCGSDVYPGDYDEGSAHPEVGWEYYECSDCGHAIPPETFDIRPPSQGDSR